MTWALSIIRAFRYARLWAEWNGKFAARYPQHVQRNANVMARWVEWRELGVPHVVRYGLIA